MFKRLMVFSTAVVASGMATAADLPSAKGPASPAPIYTPAFTWTGFYVGLQAGYAWGDTKFQYEANVTTPAPMLRDAFSTGTAPDGFVGGVYGGYNQAFGALVIGAEADISFASLKGKGLVFANGVDGVPVTSKADVLGTARLRAGYAVDRFLVFVTGGLAFSNTTFATPDQHVPVKPSQVGWTIGGGVEYAFGNSLIARLEYLYADFGSKSKTLVWDGEDGVTTGTDGFKVSAKYSIGRAGLAYKF